LGAPASRAEGLGVLRGNVPKKEVIKAPTIFFSLVINCQRLFEGIPPGMKIEIKKPQNETCF